MAGVFRYPEAELIPRSHPGKPQDSWRTHRKILPQQGIINSRVNLILPNKFEKKTVPERTQLCPSNLNVSS
jgi:hypothetical protein